MTLALSTRFILSRRTSSRPVDLPYRTHVVREVCNAGCQPPDLDIAHLTRRTESFCPSPPAPQHNGPAYWIKVSAQTDGSFTVTNARNGFSKTYKAGS